MKEKQGIHNSLKRKCNGSFNVQIIFTFILANRSFKIGKIQLSANLFSEGFTEQGQIKQKTKIMAFKLNLES